MPSTTTFGSFPGVKVNVTGGAITNIEIGREQTLVLFGRGDSANGSAAVNTPTTILSRADIDRKFGQDTELARGMKEALSNGANIDFLYGVMPNTVSNTESFAGTSSGTISQTPVSQDTVSVTDSTSGNQMSLEITYEDAPSQPTASETVRLNRKSGEWAADSSSDYEFQYEYEDYATAFDSADKTVNDTETGLYGAISDSESVASTLSGKVNELRSQYQLVMGVAGAEPNGDTDDVAYLESGYPHYDVSNYTDNVDNDAMFLHAPARTKTDPVPFVGAVAGRMVGNAIDDPVFNDTLNVGAGDLTQNFGKAQADDMRDRQVMPVRDTGSVRLRDNVSTSTESDWPRDFFRRRIVDQTIIMSRLVGDTIFGRINDEDTRESAEDLIRSELSGFADDRLIQPNTDDETNWYVDVYDAGADTVGIDIGITPYGLAKRIDVSIVVNT
jgi:hypothetical protein